MTSPRDRLEIVAATDVGRKRTHNEDTFATDSALGLVVLADGMGGYRAGEVASALAVETFMDTLGRDLRQLRLDEVDPQTGHTRGAIAITHAIARANERVYQAAQADAAHQGMGTTMASALFHDEGVSIAHVGDSRVYRLRSGQLEQLTVDHTMVQELVDHGFYTPEEARTQVQKNLLTRAVGVDPTVRADVTEELVAEGDIYLLCSDGLTDLVSDAAIESILTRHGEDLAGTARVLVEQANTNGGTDNVSVILVRALRAFPAARRATWCRRVLDWFT